MTIEASPLEAIISGEGDEKVVGRTYYINSVMSLNHFIVAGLYYISLALYLDCFTAPLTLFINCIYTWLEYAVMVLE